jgi:aminoglycoside 6'-N-acetyltransferase I
MTGLSVRDADENDAAALAALLTVLGYPTPAPVVAERLSALRRGDPSGRVLVALDGTGRALGFLTLHATPVLHRSTPVGRITALAVDPEAQGLGVGRRLVQEGERICREAGLGRLEVTSGTSHAAAYDFYRHLGYEDHGLRFAKAL